MATRKWNALGVAAAIIAAAGGAHAQERERPSSPFDRAIFSLAPRSSRKREIRFAERTRSCKLNYDQYRSIRFRNEAAIWNGENRTFTVDLFYPGFIFNVPVNINLVVAKMARRVVFTNDLFESAPMRSSRTGLTRRVLGLPSACAAEPAGLHG